MSATSNREESPLPSTPGKNPGSSCWKSKAALVAGVAVPLGLLAFADPAAAEFGDDNGSDSFTSELPDQLGLEGLNEYGMLDEPLDNFPVAPAEADLFEDNDGYELLQELNTDFPDLEYLTLRLFELLPAAAADLDNEDAKTEFRKDLGFPVLERVLDDNDVVVSDSGVGLNSVEGKSYPEKLFLSSNGDFTASKNHGDQWREMTVSPGGEVELQRTDGDGNVRGQGLGRLFVENNRLGYYEEEQYSEDSIWVDSEEWSRKKTNSGPGNKTFYFERDRETGNSRETLSKLMTITGDDETVLMSRRHYSSDPNFDSPSRFDVVAEMNTSGDRVTHLRTLSTSEEMHPKGYSTVTQTEIRPGENGYEYVTRTGYSNYGEPPSPLTEEVRPATNSMLSNRVDGINKNNIF